MQHYHRNRHRLIWLILAPVILGLLVFAVLNRPDWPEMESLPGSAPNEAPEN